jgi:hypothetical protein
VKNVLNPIWDEGEACEIELDMNLIQTTMKLTIDIYHDSLNVTAKHHLGKLQSLQ